MRILIGHNHYKIPGGEDAVVAAEHSLLKDFGEDVLLYKRSNVELDSGSVTAKFRNIRQLGWSRETYRDIKTMIRRFRPDVAHFHNIFYVITPAAYFACREEGVPVVQSQHNFRLKCANGLLYRQNKVCEECVKKSLWQGIYHGCYRDSRLLTAFIAGTLMDHWRKRTWHNAVDIYISASQFGKQKLIEMGMPGEKIAVKPNFVYPVPSVDDRKDQGYALYVGRLSEEKGVRVLLEAWKSVPDVPLRIIGEGPLSGSLKVYTQSQGIRNVQFLGYVNQKTYEENMCGARFLIVPSQCYENFPRIIVEAFARGIPVIASNLGTLRELVEDQGTGLLFEPQDVRQLTEKIRRLFLDSALVTQLGRNARGVFQKKYGVRENYEHLVSIYQRAIELSGARRKESVCKI